MTVDAELTVTKTAATPGGIDVGDPVEYMVVVSNTGNVLVSAITLSDALLDAPGDTQLVCSLVEPLVLLPGGSVTCVGTHVLTQADLDVTFVENSAIATGSDPAGEPVTDVSDAGDETVETPDGSGGVDGDPTNDPTVTVLAQPPVAVDDASLANPAGPVTLNALDGSASSGVADSDPNNDLDAATVDLDPSTPGVQDTLAVSGEGDWGVDGSGVVTFTPEAGFTEDPTPITYRVADATGLVSNAATITVDFVPVATADSSTGNVTNTAVAVDVLGNDTTGDTVDPTTVQIVGTTNPGDSLTVAGEGTWSVNTVTGEITFTPEAGFTADPADITYTVDDDEGNTANPATVSIDYTAQPPVAVDDEDLGNPPGPVTLNVVDGSASAGGVADGDPDGTLNLATIDLDPSTVLVQSTFAVAGEGDWSVDRGGCGDVHAGGDVHG